MKLVSVVFHPLLMATYTCLLIWWVFPSFFSPINPSAIQYVLIAIFTTTFLVPVFCIFLLFQSRRISNLNLSIREERIVPFFMIGGFYMLTTYLFYMKLRLVQGLIYLLAEVTLLIFVIALISLRFKISVHAAAIWGVCGIWAVLTFRYLGASGYFILLGLFLIAGLTSSSRLYLNRHTATELWFGATLGFGFGLLGTLILL